MSQAELSKLRQAKIESVGCLVFDSEAILQLSNGKHVACVEGFPYEDVVSYGLEILDYDELLELSTSPSTILALGDLIVEALDDGYANVFWIGLMERAGNDGIVAIKDLLDLPGVVEDGSGGLLEGDSNDFD